MRCDQASSVIGPQLFVPRRDACGHSGHGSDARWNVWWGQGHTTTNLGPWIDHGHGCEDARDTTASSNATNSVETHLLARCWTAQAQLKRASVLGHGGEA